MGGRFQFANGNFVSAALSIRWFRLVIPLRAFFLWRLIYGKIIRPWRFDRMVRRVGLGFAGHVWLFWRLGTVDGNFYSRHHRSSNDENLWSVPGTLPPMRTHARDEVQP